TLLENSAIEIPGFFNVGTLSSKGFKSSEAPIGPVLSNVSVEKVSKLVSVVIVGSVPGKVTELSVELVDKSMSSIPLMKYSFVLYTKVILKFQFSMAR